MCTSTLWYQWIKNKLKLQKNKTIYIHTPIYFGDWQMLKPDELEWVKNFDIKKKRKKSKACVGMKLVFYKPNNLVLQIEAFELDIDDVHSGPIAGS